MAPETLIFMPNGDVTLVLTHHVTKETDTHSSDVSALPNNSVHDKNSTANRLTTIDEDGQQEPNPGNEPEEAAENEELDDGVLYFAPDPPDGLNGPSYPPTPRAARGSDASSLRDRSASPPASFWASLKRQAARVIDTIEDEPPTTAPAPPTKPERTIVSSHEVYCVVSSRHLVLASQHFQTLLTGNSREANTLRTKGHVTIPLSVDFDTMIILLNIIHGASRKVPRQVSLDVLGKLAILVSSLGMLENVEFFSDTWIDNFQRGGLPKVYNLNVLPLLFVFWVFNRPDEFKNMTRLAQRESNERLHEDIQDVPIPHKIIDAITKDRESAMDASMSVIHNLINKYLVGHIVCDGSLDEELRYACDSMVLGSLMKSSRKIGIWPRPEEPFSGRTFKDLTRAIRSIKILDVCNKTSNRKWNSHGPSSNCHGLEDSIEASLKSIEANLDGLDLSDYAKNSEDMYSEFQKLFPAPSDGELNEYTINDIKEKHLLNRKDEVNAKYQGKQLPGKELPIEPTHLNFVSKEPTNDIRQGQRNSIPLHDVKETVEPEPRASVRGRSRDTKVHVHQERVDARPNPGQFQQPEVRVSPRASAREIREPVKESTHVTSGNFSGQDTMGRSQPYSREFQQQEVRGSPRPSIHEIREPVNDSLEAVLRSSPSQDVGITPRPYSKEIQQAQIPNSPRTSIHEIKEPTKDNMEAFSRNSPNQSIKDVPRPHSKEVHQLGYQGSPRTSIHEVRDPVKEELRASPKDSPVQEARLPRKPVESASKDEQLPLKDDANGHGDKKLNRTPSFPKIPREDVRSPVHELQVAPKLASIEEMFEKHTNPAKEIVKSSKIETRDSPTTTPTTTDAEESWAPPKNFKIRKSKKTFSTRF